MKSIATYIFFFVFLFSSLQCKKIFEYSPYDSKLEEQYKNTTSKNLNRLQQLNQHFTDTVFTIALLSDVHYFYDDLKSAVNFINSQSDLDLLLVAGDLTDGGLKQEYILLHEALSKANIPWFTVIGNHDYLSDGEEVYDQMFGPRNYSFSFANTKFILFDDVFWESGKTPDFTWLQNQFSDREQYTHVIVCNHIPARTDQFDNNSRATYSSLMTSYTVTYNISGHQHVYETGNMIGDQVPFVIVPRINEHILVKLRVSTTSMAVDTLHF
jgi:3',5'-cyclic-AMP phosphodiesterase